MCTISTLLIPITIQQGQGINNVEIVHTHTHTHTLIPFTIQRGQASTYFYRHKLVQGGAGPRACSPAASASLPSLLVQKDEKNVGKGGGFQTCCACAPLQLLHPSFSKPAQPRSCWHRQQPRHALAAAHSPALEDWNSPTRPQNLHAHFTISSSCRRSS